MRDYTVAYRSPCSRYTESGEYRVGEPDVRLFIDRCEASPSSIWPAWAAESELDWLGSKVFM